MSELANQIIDVFKKYKAWQDENLGAGYPVRMATWSIRNHLEKEHKQKFTCADIRKEIKVIDAIKLDEHFSRRGNFVWRYTA
ncbi:TPA: hypothetical protein ACQ340_002731 [Yersinia enterocolitica]